MSNLIRLARNAKLGDGSFWKHPESVNRKIVFTGVNRAHLEYKGALCGRPVKVVRKADHPGAFKNAKELYAMTTLVDPLFTAYAEREKMDVLQEFDFDDFALWYLDDGCTIEDRSYIPKKPRPTAYKYYLCIGNLCTGEGKKEQFFAEVRRVFNLAPTDRVGSIVKNNSKATENNLTWNIPIPIGRRIVRRAAAFGISGFENKIRWKRGNFNDHPLTGVALQGEGARSGAVPWLPEAHDMVCAAQQ